MDYNEVLQRARARMAPRCKVCPECNGLGCGNTMPGPGSKAPGNGANDNWRAWRRWCLNMDTIAPNTPVDTSLELLGRTFSLPVIAAPIGSLRAQFNPEDDIRDYNACCVAAAAIVVSNHGGRVLPGSAATADVLPEIADAVGDRVKILVDGGIRSGTDIFRALALGADAVMICRPFLISYYGGGTEGIVTYVEKLRAELTDAMYMCGARKLSDITRDMVREVR